jgi:hypothetical protein
MFPIAKLSHTGGAWQLTFDDGAAVSLDVDAAIVGLDRHACMEALEEPVLAALAERGVTLIQVEVIRDDLVIGGILVRGDQTSVTVSMAMESAP